MQDYIGENLSCPEGITMAKLAEVSLFSPWHSYRLFKEYTGLTPAEYIRKMRLSQSAMRLKDGELKVIDCALDNGFGSADGYTRAFRREYGCNPRDYAKTPIPIPLFVPYGVKYRALRKEGKGMENKETRNVFVSVVRKPERKVIIKRGVKAEDYFPYCEEVGCDVWGILLSMDSLCGEPVCLWLPEKYVKVGTSVYVQGVEVPPDYDGKVPDGFDVISLPAADYIMFCGEPFCEEDYCEAISAVKSAMEKYNPSVIGYEWDENNPGIGLEPRGERGYIEMRAARKIEK